MTTRAQNIMIAQPAVAIVEDVALKDNAAVKDAVSSSNTVAVSRNVKMAIGSFILFAAPTVLFLASNLIAM